MAQMTGDTTNPKRRRTGASGRIRTTAALGIAVVVVASACGLRMVRSNPFDTGVPLLADATGGERIELLEPALSIDPLSPGWATRTFLGVAPTDYSIVEVDGGEALRCTTHDSGSILARDTAIALRDYPTLARDWMIVRPIASELDEATPAGDDHPARFFVRFGAADGEPFAAEIIWSDRKYEPGQYKLIDGFHHYVANGRDENAGVWHAQTVDLERLYRGVSGRTDAATLRVLGFFRDSDDTGSSGEAYFRHVALARR